MKLMHQFSPNELRLLQIFSTVVEQGGYTPALYELNISPSTLSQHISDLEHRLDTRLCERGRSGFKLTSSGQKVYDEAQKLFASINQFTSEVHTKRGEISGDITIATLDNIISHPSCFVPAAISKFMDRPGDIHLNFWVRSPLEVQIGVQEGTYDMGIGSNLKHLHGTHYNKLYEEQHFIYCSNDHPLFTMDDDKLTSDELLQWPSVRPVFSQASNSPLRASTHSNSVGYNLECIAMLVLSGKFIGTLPSYYAKNWVEKHRLRTLKPQEFGTQLETGVIVRTDSVQQPIVQAFMKDLISAHHGGSPQ
jgi:DNA-binding transcriptional LysR family regulator